MFHPDRYHPSSFLASLGAGGLAVSIYMYFMFWLPHPGSPMATLDHIGPLLTGGTAWQRGLVGLVLLVILALAALHLFLLIRNLIAWRSWGRTPHARELRSSPSATTEMAVPLTLAMTINVMFIMGALLVPGLWSVIEWLFPGALLGFWALGLWMLRVVLRQLSLRLREGGAESSNMNHLGHLLPAFAMAMVAVGLAASAAMSHIVAVQVFAAVSSLFFMVAALSVIATQLPMAWQAMQQRGLEASASASLWVLIPILTLLGIAWIRVTHGLSHGLGGHVATDSRLLFVAGVLTLQVFVGLLGWRVMHDNGYFAAVRSAASPPPASFALICPGVALAVFGAFFVSHGLVGAGVIERASPAFILLSLPFMAVQLKTLVVYFSLLGRGLRLGGTEAQVSRRPALPA